MADEMTADERKGFDQLREVLARLAGRQRGAGIELPVSTLVAMKAPYNPRKISDDAMTRLRASLRTFGAAEPVVVNLCTGNLVGGHQRVEAARLEGWETLPVTVVDLPLDREMALNVALNNPKLAGEYVDEDLAAVFRMIEAEGGDAALTGFLEAERRVIEKGWHTDFEAVERVAPHTDGLIALIVVEAPTAEKDRVRTAVFDCLAGLGIEGARVR